MAEQNPYACSDNGCVLKVKSPSRRGVGTNSGCKCIPLKMTPHERVNLRQGIRWLAERTARLEGLLDTGYDLVLMGPPSEESEQWQEAVIKENP